MDRSFVGRVRIYLPNEVYDAPVVISSELPNNPGGSVTNSAEVIAAGVIRANRLPNPLVWIEHWPKESTDEGEETLDQVVSSRYEVTDTAPYLGQTRAWVGGRYLETARPSEWRASRARLPTSST